MKISVIDGYTENPGDLSWDGLRALGDVVIYDHSTKDEAEIIRRVGDAEIVVANKSPISRRVLDACPNVKYITVQATGYDPINYVYAREKGIPVSNVPTYGTASVAQFAIALLLEICGHAAHHSDAVHAGRWAECGEWTFWDYPMIELAGKTMGIIGFGRIGQNVGRIAKALGMNVIAFNRSRSAEGAEIAEYVELDELLCRADVVSLHCPLFPETRGIINRETISKMKDGVIIINNSRGPLVVEQDLADALNSGKRFFAQRVFQGKQEQENDTHDEVFRALIARNCSEHYKCACCIAEYVRNTWHKELSDEELVFLTIHLKRIWMGK